MKYVVYISAFAFLLQACNHKTDTSAEQPVLSSNTIQLSEAQFKNAGIVTGTLEKKTISEILKVNGKIDVPPQNMVSVSVPLGGYLKNTQLLPGMHVNKGEIIAVMEDPQYIQLQQDYLTAQSKLHYAELEYNRQRELNKDKAASDKIMQQAAAEYQGLQITLRALGEKLQLIGINPGSLSAGNISRSINIRSAINGFVTRVNVNIGKYVSPTEVLFEMVNPEDIHLNLTVFEKDVSKLFIGQKLEAYTNNDPSKKYPCEILLIGKELNQERGTDVHCHFEQYDKSLIPGTFMNAEIALQSGNHLALPEDAVVRFENRQYVFVEAGNRQYTMTEVQTGNHENGYIALKDAASLEGKTIVIKGAYSLLMGLKNKSDD